MEIRFLIFKKVKTAWGHGDSCNITNEGSLSLLSLKYFHIIEKKIVPTIEK